MHDSLSTWIEFYGLMGAETSIAQALPLLDKANATEADYDVLMAIRSWAAQAREEKKATS